MPTDLGSAAALYDPLRDQPDDGVDAASNSISAVRRRQEDVYVFAVLAHTIKPSVDPMNLDQWQFHVLP